MLIVGCVELFIS